ncbi:MAG: type II CAAX endopeptidase family protein [Nitrososphaerota archaeon]|nr:CPBP family intramembrane metalloprotease [Candidatus Calditenuis fumarioli]
MSSARLTSEKPINALIVTVAVAYILWYFAFMIEFSSFWTRLAISSTVLLFMCAALAWNGSFPGKVGLNWRALIIGICWGLGMYVATLMSYKAVENYVRDDAGAVYALMGDVDVGLVVLTLLYVSFTEELYWRGFVFETLSCGLGVTKALLLTTLFYSTIHIWTSNLPLMLVAAVAGLLWGVLYRLTRSVFSAWASHALWDLMVFVFLPLR